MRGFFIERHNKTNPATELIGMVSHELFAQEIIEGDANELSSELREQAFYVLVPTSDAEPRVTVEIE